MKIGIVSELTGGSDICYTVTDLSTLQAKEYLAPGETILFALSSPKEEYAFTNESLIAVCGESAMSTKRTVERYEYIHERIERVTFESCGITDRDCELKFHMGSHAFSIDIAKAEQPQAKHFYRVLQELSRAQAGNARKWDFAKSALDASVRAMRISDPGTTATTLLVDQAASVQAWLQDTFATTNPHCYQAVIQAALERVVS